MAVGAFPVYGIIERKHVKTEVRIGICQSGAIRIPLRSMLMTRCRAIRLSA